MFDKQEAGRAKQNTKQEQEENSPSGSGSEMMTI